MNEITSILSAIEQGDSKAADRLFPLVYTELHELATEKMTADGPGNVLQATVLVHEAWQRLMGAETPKFESRRRFFVAASEAMRQILIAQAARGIAPNHPNDERESNNIATRSSAPNKDQEMIAIHKALEKLAALDDVKAELVKMCYFAGFTLSEAAWTLGLSEATAQRSWNFARAWLYCEVNGGLPAATE